MFGHLYNTPLLDWEAMEITFPVLASLKGVAQSSRYHAEGDVYTHTKMVVEEALGDEDFALMNKFEKDVVFLSALLHDIAKPKTWEIGKDHDVCNPNHSFIGSLMARDLLYRVNVDFLTRETVSRIIHAHQKPFWPISRNNSARQIRKMSVQIQRLDLLVHQAEADNRGREGISKKEAAGNIKKFKALAIEHECLSRPFSYETDTQRRADISGIAQKPIDGFEVTLICGLPGVGKSTLARSLDKEIVSLDDYGSVDKKFTIPDDIRRKFQKKQSIVIDGILLNAKYRRYLIEAAEKSGARTSIIYMEIDRLECVRRNASRPDALASADWADIVYRMQVPTPDEAYSVRWNVDGRWVEP